MHKMPGWSRLTKHKNRWATRRNDAGALGELWSGTRGTQPWGTPWSGRWLNHHLQIQQAQTRHGCHGVYWRWSARLEEWPHKHLYCSHKAAPTCSEHHAATPCLGDHEASMVSAVTIPSIPPTQEGDPKFRLPRTIPDQHHPGQRTYIQICQPAAVKCTHRFYTFPHK